MDLRQLRYFLTVANEGQITRASKKLNMAQPPLSHQLKLLEDELGTILFERHSRSIELTEAGKLLYKRASSILSQVEDTIFEIKETGEGLRGNLTLSTVRSAAITYLPERIAQFRRNYPQVTYTMLEGNPYQVVNYLEERQVELAIVRYPIEIETEYNSITLQVEPYVLFIPKEWGWDPALDSIQMKDLKDIPLLLVQKKNRGGIYNAIYEEFLAHGVKPNIVCECPDASILFSLVASGVGATILPKSTSSVYSTEKMRIVAIADCSLQNESAVIWLKNRLLSKVAQRFIEMF